MQINKLYAEGKTSEEIHAISQGPDDCARVFNRCFINGFLFRTAQIEKNLSMQNSGVVVKGDGSAGNVYWYGVVKKIYAHDFPTGKEVIQFECNWYDIPTTSKSKGRGFKRDQYGIPVGGKGIVLVHHLWQHNLSEIYVVGVLVISYTH